MTGHLASTPTCFDWTALGIKIMPRGFYDHLTVLEMHVHWSFFYFAFIFFFQWICTKIGCAAKRPRGIWICSTWSEMYVYLRNILRIRKWNTRISWQNTKWTYYTQRKVSHWSQILSSIFFLQPRLWGIALQTCHLVQFPLVQFTRSPDFLFCSFFFGLKNIFLCGIVNLKRIAKFLESPLSLPWERLIAISQALKWISNAVFW